VACAGGPPLQLGEHHRPGYGRPAPRLGKHLLDGGDHAGVCFGPGSDLAQLAPVGQADKPFLAVSPSQPLQMAVCHRPPCRLELGDFGLLALVKIMQGRVVFVTGRLLGMLPCLELDEMALEPANAFLLGCAQRSKAAILRYPPWRRRAERLKAWCRQQVAEQDSRQFAVLVLQRHSGPIELDDRIDIFAECDPVSWPQNSFRFLRYVASRGSALTAKIVVSRSGLDKSAVSRHDACHNDM
jgi:hypothetical protein